MKIGVPKEVKADERRVAVTPWGAESLVRGGHTVAIERGAGEGSGFSDAEYLKAGAQMADTAAEVWAAADMVMKVKEPVAEEFGYFREGLILFAYLHLAAAPELAAVLARSGVAAIAYETVESGGALPLLTPMSEVAGRMAAQIGAQLLESPKGGRGILLGGVPGVRRGKVTVIGGGTVGVNAARIAVGLGADVTILDVNAERLRQLELLFRSDVQTLASSSYAIAESVAASDLVIGAVLIPGAKAPRLVTEEMVAAMQTGSAIVDVAIDQGGIVATIDRVTTHAEPTYRKHGVLHYAVANMPGAVPRTSTIALTNATLPYAQLIAADGLLPAVRKRADIRSGVNIIDGRFAHPAVAEALQTACEPVRV